MSTQLEYCETYVRLKKEFSSPLKKVCSNDQDDCAKKGCEAKVDLSCCWDLGCCNDWTCCREKI